MKKSDNEYVYKASPEPYFIQILVGCKMMYLGSVDFTDMEVSFTFVKLNATPLSLDQCLEISKVFGSQSCVVVPMSCTCMDLDR